MSVFIDLNEASGMTRNFRNDKEAILDTQYQNTDLLPFCETFDAAQVLSMLGNPGCAGLRVYYGMDQNKKVHAVLVGVDAEDKDMLPENDDPGNYILERSARCPQNCPPSSPLNS